MNCRLSKDCVVDFIFVYGARLYFLFTALKRNIDGSAKYSAQELIHAWWVFTVFVVAFLGWVYEHCGISIP